MRYLRTWALRPNGLVLPGWECLGSTFASTRIPSTTASCPIKKQPNKASGVHPIWLRFGIRAPSFGRSLSFPPTPDTRLLVAHSHLVGILMAPGRTISCGDRIKFCPPKEFVVPAMWLIISLRQNFSHASISKHCFWPKTSVRLVFLTSLFGSGPSAELNRTTGQWLRPDFDPCSAGSGRIPQPSVSLCQPPIQCRRYF